MRLLRIRLVNYRGTAAREIHIPRSGTVVIAGPNEAGKSTLIQAFHLALRYKDTSRAAEVRETQPLGTDLPTEVEVEFELDGYHLILSRRYHRDSSTRLQVLAPQREDVAGREADERLERILDGRLDADLLEALHIGQDERQLEQARPNPWGGAMADVLNAGREAGGCRLDTTLVDMAATERAHWFTPTGRENRGFKELTDRVRRAESEVEQIRRQQEDLNECVTEHEAVQVGCTGLQERKVQLDGELDGLSRRRRIFEEAQRIHQLVSLEAGEAAARSESAKSAWEVRAELAARVDKWESHIAELTRLDDEARAEREAVRQEAARLRAAAEQAGEASEGAARASEKAAVVARRADIADRLSTAGAQLATERARAEAQVAQDVPRLVIESLGVRSIEVDGTTVSLNAAKSLLLPAEKAVQIEIADCLRIRVEPGEAAEQSRAAAEEAAAIVTARLKETVARLTTELQSLGGDPSIDPREATQRASEGADLARNLRSVAGDASSAAARSEAAQRLLDETHLRHTDQLAQAQRAVDDDREALLAARQLTSDDSISEAMTKANEAAETALVLLAESRAKVQEVAGDSLASRVAGIEQELAEVGNALADRREKLTRLAERARLMSEQGLHTQLQDAQIQLDSAKQEAAAERRRAEVANRLWATLDKHRLEAENAYRDPLRSRIDELGQSLLGPSFSVEMDHDLTVSTRRLDGQTVPVAQLSAGAREQLALIGRVACASLAAKDGAGAPLILDDTLGFSDPERRRGVVKVLNEATVGCQVIVLTCDPDRYADLVAAERINL